MRKRAAAEELHGVAVVQSCMSNHVRLCGWLLLGCRMQELGAVAFYPCAEADEVDGLEATVDPWVEQILTPLQKALQEIKQEQAAQPGAAAAAVAPAAAETDRLTVSRPASAAVADAAAAPAELAAVPAAVQAEGARVWLLGRMGSAFVERLVADVRPATRCQPGLPV